MPIELVTSLASLGVGGVLGGLAIWLLNQEHIRNRVENAKSAEALLRQTVASADQLYKQEQKHSVTLEAMFIRSEKTNDRMLMVIEANTRAWEKVSVALDNISAASLKEVGDRLERLERRERP